MRTQQRLHGIGDEIRVFKVEEYTQIDGQTEGELTSFRMARAFSNVRSDEPITAC